MTKGWDWVIGTGLYVAALVLTWLTLFAMERFGAFEVRAWAPFLQALLSAGAIFAAFALQERKRLADLEDAQRALRHTFAAKTRAMEHLVAWVYDLAVKEELRVSEFKRQARHFSEDVEDLRRLPMEKLRDREEISATNFFTATSRQLQSAWERELERASVNGKVDVKLIQYWVGQVFRRRDHMLAVFELDAEPTRLKGLTHALQFLEATRAGGHGKDSNT